MSANATRGIYAERSWAEEAAKDAVDEASTELENTRGIRSEGQLIDDFAEQRDFWRTDIEERP